MRNVLSKKLNNRKGFTLAELLIVVAIIAVLVAIMIPVFGASRANALLAKNAANVRSVYAEKLVAALESATGSTVTVNITEAECNISGTGATVKYNTTDKCIEVTVPNATIGDKESDKTTMIIKVDSDVTINGMTTTT